MGIIYILLSALLVLLCVAIVVMILMQKKSSSGMGGVMSGMGASQQTFWDKNKSRSLEGTLEKYTKICGAAFMIISFLLNIIK
jgi:preprotein translocase subunit SecG